MERTCNQTGSSHIASATGSAPSRAACLAFLPRLGPSAIADGPLSLRTDLASVLRRRAAASASVLSRLARNRRGIQEVNESVDTARRAALIQQLGPHLCHAQQRLPCAHVGGGLGHVQAFE